MNSQFTERLTKLPAVPKRFGDDGGKFYGYYDQLADELDEDMVTSLKSQLDGILIFAGLFAGVNSAFLAFTLPQMSADPVDDTNALLFQIMRGANGTITSPADLPSASFSPPTGALPINILFSMSLTLALLASFLAVLGQQWLVYYRKRSGGGAEYQRWEQLRRYLGAKRWRLELVLDDVLPSVLQIALVIFCAAFILYLGTLSKSLCYAIAAPLCVVAVLILAMAISAAWDRWCPFKSPLSHVVQPILQASISALGGTISLPISFTIMAFRFLVHVFQSGSVPSVVTVKEGDKMMTMSFFEAAGHRARSIGEWFKRNCQRSAEAVNQLELIALKRVLCTSEDSSALVYAALNGQAIFDQQLLRQILDDDECRARIHSLYRSGEVLWNQDTWQNIQLQAVAYFLFHVVFSCGSLEDFLPPDHPALVADQTPSKSLRDVVDDIQFEIKALQSTVSAADRAECPSRAALWNCMELVWLSLGPDLATWTNIEAFVQSVSGLKPLSGLSTMDRFGPVEPVWFLASGLKQAKAYDMSLVDEIDEDMQSSQALQRLRGVLLSYQRHLELSQSNTLEVITDAIATLASPWNGQQPDHEIYVVTFEQALPTDFSPTPSGEVIGAILNSLLTLLRSLERRIRDSATPPSERKAAREYRTRCATKFIVSLKEYHFYKFVPDALSYIALEFADSIHTHFGWMKEIMGQDPMNPENRPMLESFKIILSIFPKLSNSGARGMRSLAITEAEADDLIIQYDPLYPTLLRAVSDIEATLPPARAISKEVLPEHTHGVERKDLSWDTSFEWWGN